MTIETSSHYGKRITELIIYLIVLTVLFCGILLIDTFHGDPTIYLVYARNIAKGDFFAFNPGQFSSGATSPLWAAILSAGFLTEAGVFLAKVTSLITTIIAVYVCYKTLLRVSGSNVGSAVGTALTAMFVTLPGLLMYESSLVVILVYFLIFHSYQIFSSQGTTKHLAVIGIVWAMIPVTRPDASVIIVIHFFVLVRYFYGKSQTDAIRRLVLFLSISLVPSLVYYGYSFLQLGTFSVSSTCRAFALQESAASLAGFSYSVMLFKFFLESPMIMFMSLLLWGVGELTAQRKNQALVLLSIASIVVYFVLLSLISPVTRGVERYVLPIIPFVALLASVAARELWKLITSEKRQLFLAFFLGTLILLPLFSIVNSSLKQSMRGLSFDVITEKEVIDYINHSVEKNATVLIYEVQDRYYLRQDISLLSLDGITDGKVAPYFHNKDMYSFLLKYRPDYWLANDAVHSRPYLSGSILERVVDETGYGDTSSIQIKGIKFTRILVRNQDFIPGFAGYRQLYEIEYLD